MGDNNDAGQQNLLVIGGVVLAIICILIALTVS
jgi:hypothetical protein